MPEYGGWFAPLTEFLPEASVPISNFHRCNLALILLTDLVVDGLDLDCHRSGHSLNFFQFSFCENSLICLEGKSMTPHRGTTILFRSSQQLPRLRLGPSKGFLS